MIDTNLLIQEFLDTQSEERLKIAVIGDVMIDEYYEVSANRISPEFPIQILDSNSRQPSAATPGGAANVAWQISNFNVDCTLFCAMHGGEIEQLQGFDFDVVATNNERPIPRKRRFYDQEFAVMRWDIEDHTRRDNDKWTKARKELLAALERHIRSDGLDILILSDYNKGFFHGDMAQDIIELCHDYEVPTLVDPKTEPLEQWKGCTIFKPNAKECNDFIKSRTNYAEDLVKALDCEAVVITSGAEGVFTHLSSAPSSHYQINKTIEGHPLGYSGAGDCFAAVYAIAYAHNFNFRESSTIAYNAGSIFVQDKYNDPITPFMLLRHIDPIKSKIQDANALVEILQNITGEIVLTNGCYDILHVTHLQVLRYAKNIGDILVVAVNSDDSIKRLKGDNRPIIPLNERMQLLASLEFVDFVIAFNEDTPQKIIEQIRPKYLVKGGDYKGKEIVGSNIVEQTYLSPYIEGDSTTDIIKRINARHI